MLDADGVLLPDSHIGAYNQIAQNSRTEPKPTADALLAAYKKGITFYPGAVEMIRITNNY